MNPVDEVELRQGIVNLAEMAGLYFSSLLGQGFTREEALTLTGQWLMNISQGGGGREVQED